MGLFIAFLFLHGGVGVIIFVLEPVALRQTFGGLGPLCRGSQPLSRSAPWSLGLLLWRVGGCLVSLGVPLTTLTLLVLGQRRVVCPRCNFPS